MEEVHGADALCPAEPKADRAAWPGRENVAEPEPEPERGVAGTERRVAEQRMYRALVDYATGRRDGAPPRDGWAGALPGLLASWRALSEKYDYGKDRPGADPPPSDAGSWSGDGGRRLDAVRNAEIDAGYARIREVGENVIAPAILRITAEDPTRSLAGFDRRIKGEDRLKEKVADEMRSTPGISSAQALATIADVVRFTFTYSETAYTEGAMRDVARLEAAGFNQVERRNTWSSEQYRGINSRWREPESGVIFEVQFHTRASLEAKELTHAAYERIRGITDETAETLQETTELKAFQHHVCSKIPIPPDVMDYGSYRPERRND